MDNKEKYLKIMLTEDDIEYKIIRNKVYDLEIYVKNSLDIDFVKLDFKDEFYHQYYEMLISELVNI